MATEEEAEKKKQEEAETQRKKEKAESDAREETISDIIKLIATIAPDYYALEPNKIKKLKAEGKFWEAVKSVKPRTPLEPAEQYQLSYNSSSEGLEPVYFWILDFMDGLSSAKCEKLIDNFTSSPGSGHFSELMGKATRMQEEGMKVMQTIGVLTKSIIPIIYDLRQFETRLEDYKNSHATNKDKREGGLLSLKQIWMDNVDIKRGNSSLKAMTFSQQGAFVTLLNAFMAVNTQEDIDKQDLNDIVKRILRQRLTEFETWKKLSESELRKRYSIERAWLKSQVESLKLYSRWAKPYLKAAEQLRMNPTGLNSALVTAFNTMTMQLVILKKDQIKVEEKIVAKQLPKGFRSLQGLKTMNSCVFVEIKFRGIPQRIDQHYAFGGKADVVIRTYGLSDDELAELKKRLGESDMNEAFKLAQNATDESIKILSDDIEYFLKDVDEREETALELKKSQKPKTEDVNPFTALAGKGTFWGTEEKKKTGPSTLDKKDNFAEKVIRSLAAFDAKKTAFTVYDIYKKAHGMAAQPFGDLILSPNDVKVTFKEAFQK